MAFQSRLMIFKASHCEKSSVNLRVKCFYSAIKDFREASYLSNLNCRYPCINQSFSCSSCR